MILDNKLWIAQSDIPILLCPKMANRHGLVTGATGTGKTTTVKVLAESFSSIGVPVFISDVKGDISGLSQPGVDSEKMQARINNFGIQNWTYTGFPTEFWDIFGDKGHPIRVTISDMGPTLISRLLSLSDVQEGVLNLVFHIADEKGLMLLDLKDLRSMLSYCADHRTEFTTDYGNMSAQSIGAIQRALLTLEEQGGDEFFGEPSFNIADWINFNDEGKGYINILNATKLINSPLLYSTFLLWMMSELFEKLPEEGDMELPKMVFFFDEAHLLFNDAPKALLDKVTQIVKLIRSKGVGIYFISQNPSDIPDSIQGQLQNRIQHALHAYTPAEQKAVKVAASTFRANPNFSTIDAISNLGVGEVLVSFLDEKGVPTIVEQAKVLPPQSLMAPASDELVKKMILNSDMEDIYRVPYDRSSAYELINIMKMSDEELKAKALEEEERIKAEAAKAKEEAAKQKEEEKAAAAKAKEEEKAAAAKKKEEEKAAAAKKKEEERAAAAKKKEEEKAAAKKEKEAAKYKNIMMKGLERGVSSAGTQLGRSIMRGILGTKK